MMIHSKMRAPTASTLVIGALLIACPSEPPDPSGNFERPSGLAYVPRSEAEHADLYIADSEAEGVRALQLRRVVTNGVPADSHRFVEGPAIYFPLIVAATGFPTRLAFGADRLYTLAPARGLIHVLDVREIPYGAGFSAESHVGIGSFVLPEDAIGVDLTVLTSSNGVDLVAVVVDSVSTVDGRIDLYRVRRDENVSEESIELVDTATIAAGPRQLIVRERAILVSSAATSSISVVGFDTPAGRFLSSGAARVGVGGPTSGLIDAGQNGVLALRLDRSAAVLLNEPEAGRYARSDLTFRSPFTPPEERGAAAIPGQIDLRDPVAAAGSHGRVESIGHSFLQVQGDESTRTYVPIEVESDRGDDGLVDGVFFAHADGRASFLVGTPPRLAIAQETEVQRITRIDGSDVKIRECADVTDVCESRSHSSELPVCEDRIIPVDRPYSQTLRAVYRGSLVVSRGGEIVFIDSSTVARTLELYDEARDFSSLGAEAGDEILIHFRARTDCESDVFEDVSGTGIIAQVEPNYARIEIEGGIAGLPACDENLPVAVYEIYPAGEEMVVWSNGAFEARIPVTTSDGGMFAAYESDVSFTVTSSGGFDCTLSSERLCTTSSECGPGRSCLDPGAGQDDDASTPLGCPSVCESECAQGIEECHREEVSRRCSAIELYVQGTSVLSPALSSGGAPDFSVFVPLRRSWISSFPGARELVEAVPQPGSGVAIREIR